MYSVVMVVAMAGAPEVPSDCCFKDKFCCWKDKWSSKCGGWGNKCGKDYGCAKTECAPAPCPPPPAPVAVAPAPCAQPTTACCDTGYKSKKCCFFSCCDKGYSSGSSKGCCDKGYSNGCDTGYKSKKCCFFSCCGKGGDYGYGAPVYAAPAPGCGTTVIPPAVAPELKKDMPKVDPKAGKVGG